MREYIGYDYMRYEDTHHCEACYKLSHGAIYIGQFSTNMYCCEGCFTTFQHRDNEYLDEYPLMGWGHFKNLKHRQPEIKARKARLILQGTPLSRIHCG